jgi:hypothetical protein
VFLFLKKKHGGYVLDEASDDDDSEEESEEDNNYDLKDSFVDTENYTHDGMSMLYSTMSI